MSRPLDTQTDTLCLRVWGEGDVLLAEYAHRVEPGERWVRHHQCRGFAGKFVLLHARLCVLLSAGRKEDGSDWLHVSVAHEFRMPTYAEIAEVKRRFVGADRKALQVFPPESAHVNLHPHCFHLWSRLDGPDCLPEFSGVVGGVRMI